MGKPLSLLINMKRSRKDEAWQLPPNQHFLPLEQRLKNLTLDQYFLEQVQVCFLTVFCNTHHYTQSFSLYLQRHILAYINPEVVFYTPVANHQKSVPRFY